MGYRSDLRVILKKKDFQALKKKAQEYKFENPNYQCTLFEEDTILILEENKNWIKFGWEYLKWYYPEFEEVKLIQDFITSRKHFHFLRVGEDYGDVQEIDNLDYEPGNDCLSPSYAVQMIQD